MKLNDALLKLRIPSDIKEKIEQEADSQMRTPSSFVRIILEKYFYPTQEIKVKRKAER